MAYVSEADLVPGQSQSMVDRLTCPVCTDLFKDPVIAGGICQHVFCRGCLLQAMQARANCPLCERDLDGAVLEPSLIIQGFLDDLLVTCVYDGCTWTGPFGSRQAHVRSCPNGPLSQELRKIQRRWQELETQRVAIVQEQGQLDQRRAQFQQALGEGIAVPPREAPAAPPAQPQELELQALRQRNSDLEQALNTERTQRQAWASETQRVQQQLANQQRQDQESRRRIAELEEALEAERTRHRAPAPAFQPAGRQPQVAPPNRYARLSQAEQRRNNEQMRDAARGGNVSEVSRLLNEDLVDVNGQDGHGQTALWEASKCGHVDVVERLLQAGADVNRARDDGWTPLYIASFNGHANVVERLLQAGADVNRPKNDGQTPLYIASASGRVDLVERLLQAGADVNKATNNGETPLRAASARGHVNMVERLLQARANPNQAANDGRTPLSVVCSVLWADHSARPKIERLLRQAGGR